MRESHESSQNTNEEFSRLFSPLEEMKQTFEQLLRYVTNFGTTPFEQKPDFSSVEDRIKELTQSISRSASTSCLESYEPEAEMVKVGKNVYRKMKAPAVVTYMSLDGPLPVKRYRYRQMGVRNGPTIVPLELKAGIVEGYLTPIAACATARYAQSETSREAFELCHVARILPMSRSSFQTYGIRIGQGWETHREEGEIYLMEKSEIPASAHSVSVCVDRVTLPMSEPRERTLEEIATGEGPKNPISVNYKSVYCGVLTIHDAQGNALEAIRYGRIPVEGASETIEEAMRADLMTMLLERPNLEVVTLADGAPEMQKILDHIVQELPEIKARMIDFWHVIEKLASAIRVVDADDKTTLPSWRYALKNDDSAIDRILTQLLRWSGGFVDKEQPKELREAITYLKNNKRRMRYASARKATLPIGSGHVEATCKTLVTVRMKRAGSHWKEGGAQAILGLRSLAMSTRWDNAMEFLLDTYVECVEIAS